MHNSGPGAVAAAISEIISTLGHIDIQWDKSDRKKSRICPILYQSVPLLAHSNLTALSSIVVLIALLDLCVLHLEVIHNNIELSRKTL